MNFTSSIPAAILVLGVIIVIHELGHFLMAKLFRIKVETFSVGFGPRLVGFRRGDTDYRISAFPLGGYVKMAGENPGDTVTGAPNEFLSKPKWQRFLVAIAGPAMNVVLSVGLLTGLYMYGTEVPEVFETQAVVGTVEADSPADRAGVQRGDKILVIDGQPMENWQDVGIAVLTNAGRKIAVTLERDGQRIDTMLTPIPQGRSETGYAGWVPSGRTVISGIRPGYPAEAAGVQLGDEVIAVDGVDLRGSGISIPDAIQQASGPTFPITLLRDGERVTTEVTPVEEDGRKIIGIEIQPQYPMVRIQLGFVGALQRSLQFNRENAALIFDVMGRLFTGGVSMKSLDGPIGIVRISGQAAEVGLGALITLMALISLNLGILNLLPIPILDGGVMLLLAIEGLMGRDLSMNVKERIVQVSFVFLLMLMVVVLYNDVLKLLPG